MMNTLRLSIAVAVLACSAGCGNVERSRDLANPEVSGVTLARQVCSNCHGSGGSAVSPNFPNLAGQSRTYLAAQLRGFKSQDRRDPAGFEYMFGLSRRLTDAQIDALADYYAGQQLVRQPVEGDERSILTGKAVFANGIPARGVPPCTACHGSGGMGEGANPRLAGQHADYVRKQLDVFQRTPEARPEGSAMKIVAHGLDDSDIAGLAAYVQSLPER